MFEGVVAWLILKLAGEMVVKNAASPKSELVLFPYFLQDAYALGLLIYSTAARNVFRLMKDYFDTKLYTIPLNFSLSQEMMNKTLTKTRSLNSSKREKHAPNRLNDCYPNTPA